MDELTVSYGTSRKSKTWKADYPTWEEFVKKLQKFEVKDTTLAEYKAMTKIERADVKDGKAFVGGSIKGDRRTKETVESRSMLTLDADSISDLDEFLFDVDMVLGDVAYLIYSTLSHTPKNPRLRLIVPLSEEVEADKHEAIARKIAGNIGMDNFDKTTFDVNRLMYLPAKLKDAETLFMFNGEQEPLDVQSVLDEYFDWTNWGEWDRHEDVDIDMARKLKKAEDPTTKAGHVGIFCRTYSISEAIETFLSDKYEPCDGMDDRYTYVGSSTAAGLVVYDNDTFCHSHHSTDPISGQMVNAYDLVRLHLYEHLDEAAGGKLIAGKRPSDKMMNVKVDKDKQCKRTIMAEKEQEFTSDFGEVEFDYEEVDDSEQTSDHSVATEEVEKEDPDAWKENLAMEGNELLPTTQNFALIIDNGKWMKGRFAYNEFTSSLEITKPVPWRDKRDWENGKVVRFADEDMTELRVRLEKMYDLRRKDMLEDAHLTVSRKNRYHPIKEYIESEVWDGVPRAETLFIDHVGADDSEYVRQVTRKTLLAAVTRLYEPGTKYDYMPVLVGGQGVGKSSILSKLAVRPEWFNDSLDNLDVKVAGEQLQAGWIFELNELAPMAKNGLEVIKKFLSATKDMFRPAYGKHVVEYQRKNVFFGTTNEIDFLRDKTGNRRFFPITTKLVKGKEHWNTIPMNKKGDAGFKYMHQLWAEVYTWYMDGEGLYLDERVRAIAEQMQSKHTRVDDFEEALLEWLDEPEEADEFEIGEPILRTEVTAHQIYKEIMNGDEPIVPAKINRKIKLLMDHMDGWEESVISFKDDNGKRKQRRGYKRL